ncbi:MAG: alpha/beta hydrolase [Ruminococcus sp.]|nr:alpha/beta hydrolase [Ruminococcus sp.]
MPDKSFLASAAEPVIRLTDGKRKFVDRDACTAYISSMAKQSCHLPGFFSGRIFQKQLDGCVYYEIPSDGSDERILYLHGGSYFAPPNFLHWDMLVRIAEQTKAQILIPMYPRAPIHTVSSAYSFLNTFYENILEDKKISFMGDSAGGGLALGFALELAEKGKPLPQRMVLLSPWIDVSMENAEMTEYEDSDPMLGIYGLARMGKIWAGNVDLHDPKVSPIYGELSLLSGIDITVFAGTHEIFYPEALRLEKRLKESGADCRLIVGEGMNHVWVSYPMREGREAIEQISELFKK